MWKNTGNQSSGGKVSKWKSKLTNQPEDQQQPVQRKAGGQTGLCIDQMIISLMVHNSDYSEEEFLINQMVTYKLKSQNGQEVQEVALKEGDFIELSISSVNQTSLNQSNNNQNNNNNSSSPSPQLSSNNQNGGQNSSNTQQYINNQHQSNAGVGNQSQGSLIKRVILKVKNETFKINEQLRQQKLQISLLKSIADLYNIKPNMSCKLRVLQENQDTQALPTFGQRAHNSIDEFENFNQPSIEAFIADRIEVSFRDQYVSRRDMWYVLKSLENKTMYKGKNIEHGGIRFRIRGLFNNEGQEILNGLVRTNKTKFSFFTRSCQIYILVEMSEDMYQFDENGFLGYEKCIQFLKSYFERCQKISATHEITVVIYSRLFYPQATCKDELRKELAKFYGVSSNISDDQMDQFGAYQISKHTKIFQDVYLKVGLFELGRNNWDKIINNLKRYFNYYPSMINWTIGCPKHVDELRKYYPKEQINNQSFYGSIDDLLQDNDLFTKNKHYLMPCRLGNAQKQNILEAINLALFNLNNEEEDQNLKTTGQQLMIISAGSGSYRVNADIVDPTKSRVLLGGIPIQIVSLCKRPNFKTPLLINCCSYQNPFKNKTQSVVMHYGNIGALSPMIIESPTSFGGRGMQERLNSSFQEQSSPMTKTAQQNENMLPDYFYPYWMDIVYLCSTKLFETHLSQVTQPFNAVYKIQKLTPAVEFKPHQDLAFLNDVNRMEQEYLKQIAKEKVLKEQQQFDDFNREEEKKDISLKKQEDIDPTKNTLSIDQSQFILKKGPKKNHDFKEFLDELDDKNFSSTTSKRKKSKKSELKTAESFNKIGQPKFHKISQLQNQKQNSSTYKKGTQQDGQVIGGSRVTKQRSFIEMDTKDIIGSGSLDYNKQFDIMSYGQKSNELDNITEEDTSNKKFSVTSSSQFAQSVQDRQTFEEILPMRNGQNQNLITQFNSNKRDNSFVVQVDTKLQPFNQKRDQFRLTGVQSPTMRAASLNNLHNSQDNYKDTQFNPFNFQEEAVDVTLSKINANMNSKASSKRVVHNYTQQNSSIPLKKKSANKNRWRHYPFIPSQNNHKQLTDKEIEVLIKFGKTQQLELIMEGFWKNLCECKLLPLTTDYFPQDSLIGNKAKYHYELSQANFFAKKGGLITTVEEYLTEYICLRLTQNFQLINSEETCHFDFKQIWKTNIKMGICSKYNVLKQHEPTSYMIDTFTKMDLGDTNAIKSADFKYLLFNQHTSRFQIKISQESRLFNFKSLANLGEVLNDFKNAPSVCIKMPQQHFVIFHNNNQNSWQNGQQLPMKQMMSQSNNQLNRGSLVHMSQSMVQNISANMNSTLISGNINIRTGTIDTTNLGMNLSEVNNITNQSMVRYESMQQDDIFKQMQQSQFKIQNQHFMELEGDNYNEELEKEHFLNLKQQIFDLLTKNRNSKFNNTHNLNSINNIEILKKNHTHEHNTQKILTTAYIEDETNSKVTGAYFLTHDKQFIPDHCFHIVRLFTFHHTLDCLMDICQWSSDLRENQQLEKKSQSMQFLNHSCIWNSQLRSIESL
eukprot:403342460